MAAHLILSAWLAASLAIVLGGACGHADPQVPRPPLGTTHTAPPGTMPPDTQPPPLAEVPPVLRELAAAVTALGAEGQRDHARVVAALDALSAALVVVARPGTRMRPLIDPLRASPHASTLHADYVRTALDEALAIAVDGTPRAPAYTRAYAAAVASFEDAISAIDPEQPLLEQHDRVVAALRAVTTALHVALGLPAP
jgi:hypothetical protein